jgi:hypothetical protein
MAARAPERTTARDAAARLLVEALESRAPLLPVAAFFGLATSAVLEPDVGVEAVHAALAPEA